MSEFPKNFLWGAATSSHQVEGNNIHNDWWQWESLGKLKEPSGLACDHYQAFEKDFDLASQLQHNAHRLSIEWSRIQPKRDEFNQSEIDHYLEVIRALRQRNIEPIVTLHHFTNPRWLEGFGGWINPEIVECFTHYVEKVVMALGQDVTYWITINEPMVFLYHAFILGIWPPGEKSVSKTYKVLKNLILAHAEAYKIIHRIYQEKGWSRPQVSMANNILTFWPCRNSLLDKFAVNLRERVYNQLLLKVLTTGWFIVPGLVYEYIGKAKGTLDFIGLNYYSRHFIRFNIAKPQEFFGQQCSLQHHKVGRVNVMDFEVYPQGLLEVLLRLKRYNLPIIITENGTAEVNDNDRWQFIYEHLKYLSQAIGLGIDVRGYLYWSLLDNFEWHHGFSPRFGLIDVDYKTQARKIRESARKFAQVCRSNTLEDSF